MKVNGPDKSGLEKTADFVNYLLALATGSLVFSAELIKKDYPMFPVARGLVLLSWFLLAASIFFGILTYMRIPIMLSEQNYDLEDKYMIWPGRIQQLAFLFGIPVLGIALAILLWHKDLGGVVETPTPAKIVSEIRPPSNHFVIAKSAKVKSPSRNVHRHTFLLNEATGEVWEMKCSSGGSVEFRKVSVAGLSSQPTQK